MIARDKYLLVIKLVKCRNNLPWLIREEELTPGFSLDSIDVELLRNAEGTESKPISEIIKIKTFFRKQTLYNRITALAAEGYLAREKTKKYVLVTITPTGRAALKEAET